MCVNLQKLHLLGLSSNCISPIKAVTLGSNLNKRTTLKALLLGNMALDVLESLLVNTAQQFVKLTANLLPRAQGEANHVNTHIKFLCIEVIKIQLMEYFVTNYDRLYGNMLMLLSVSIGIKAFSMM